MQNENLHSYDYPVILPQEKPEQPVEIPAPDNPPWGILAGLMVWGMSVAFIVVMPVFFLAPYLFQKGIALSDAKAVGEFAVTDKTAIILQLLSVIPAHVFTLLVAWAVATRFNKFSFRQTLGWNWGGFKWWYAFAITFFFYGVAILLTSILGKQETEFDRMLQSSRTAVYLVAFFATFTAPLVEEVVYRGILFSALQNPKRLIFKRLAFLNKFQEFYAKHSTFFAVLIVTFLFALVHVPQYSNNNTPDYATVASLLMLSLVLTMVRVKTKNLLPCIVLHTVFNGIQAIVLVAYPYLEQYGKSVQENPASIINFLK